MTLITLLSDFGLADQYVAQMKGVIRSSNSNTEIIDISHGIEKHNVIAGSYVLETTVPFFPDGTIHVAVVDPGVGGTRLPIAVKCHHGILIGPDNGLLSRAADRLGFKAAYEIRRSHFKRNEVSNTFHGRDIFSYTAAAIANGRKPSEVGPKLSEIIHLNFPDVTFSEHLAACSVLYVDSFGNIVTNITRAEYEKLMLRDGSHVKLSTEMSREGFEGMITSSYETIPVGSFGVLLGSQGYLEIVLKESSAAERLRLKIMDRLRILFS